RYQEKKKCTEFYSSENVSSLSDSQFLLYITDSCRYDKLVRPLAKVNNETESGTLTVYARVYVFFLGSIEAQSLQFTAQLLLQLQWQDPRLKFDLLRGPVVGESFLKERLWVPHLYLSNERDSFVMGGRDSKDVLISIQPDGTVLYSSRVKLNLFCLMDLQKFPFDHQECPLSFESYMSVTLVIHFHLTRQIGHYVMDYFLPSILLVGLSWIAFWLDPNAVPGRVTLATEIWFMVCTGFIFGSLIEFAFVNTIWRRRKNVELKKVNSKYILRSTLTPRMHRKYNGMKGGSLSGSTSGELDRSWTSIGDLSELKQRPFFTEEGKGLHKGNRNNMLSVQSVDGIGREGGDMFPSTMTVDSSLCTTLPAGTNDKNIDCVSVSIPVPSGEPTPSSKSFTTMTPQEIATWIDRRSRVVFPVSFLIFNMLYWGFVWI
ncbi:hypothetical protein J437_LFUL019211, partial [Ladona fulva]